MTCTKSCLGDDMAKSFGEALSKGVPVVFTRKGTCPEVICESGKETEALQLLEKMNIITLLRPQDGRQVPGTIKPFDEKPYPSDLEILEEAGWTVECESPFEIRHEDGSFATGMAARIVADEFRRQYDEDTKAGRHT